MIRRPPRSTLSSSSAASDVYKRQLLLHPAGLRNKFRRSRAELRPVSPGLLGQTRVVGLPERNGQAIGGWAECPAAARRRRQLGPGNDRDTAADKCAYADVE